jgi:hypothetical protein
MQVDQRRVLERARGRLVQSLAIQRERRARLAEPPRGLHEVALGDAADPGGGRRRVLAHGLAQRVKALGVRADVRLVEQPLPQQQVQHAVEQHDIGAGRDGEVQVRLARGVGAARVHDDHAQVLAARARRLEAAVEHRVRDRVLDVLVAARRGVGAKRGLVARDRGGHAQARVGVDVVRADDAARELVEDVIVLGQELPRHVERDRVGPMLGDDRGKSVGDVIERLVPAHPGARAPSRAPQFGMERSRFAERRACGEMQRRALRAEAPEVRGMVGIAVHAADRFAVGLDHHAAADAAIAAGRADLSGGAVHGRATR